MANYAIMRIEKRKLPSVGRINKHHERLKEEYKSNPDIDRGRTGTNYHIIAPSLPYRDAVLARIEQAGARRRKDSVVLQDCFVGGTPDWLKAKSQEEQREYFDHAYQFFEDNFGKENIISAVVHMDEATPHMHLCFVPITAKGRLSSKDIIEVFFGAGWVFFGREKQPGQLEVINDRDGQIVNLFRCIKYHRAALQEELEWLVSAREIFFAAIAQLHTDGLTDIQRAARFYYVLKNSFGSNRKTFATSGNGIGCSIDYLEQVQLRLKGVKIENRDFEPILKTYDRPDALFYLDPPYLGTEKLYEGIFGWEDHLRLAANLKELKGRFVLSYNDDPRIRELYDWCDIKATARRETLSGAGKNQSSFKEIIIRNY